MIPVSVRESAIDYYDPIAELKDSVIYFLHHIRSFHDVFDPCGGAPNPAIVVSLRLCLMMALVCFISSLITGKTSQVDKLWSIAPVFYASISASYAPEGGSARTSLMAFLVAVWGFRLSFNFARRGGYGPLRWRNLMFLDFLWSGGEEDYRWSILRSGEVPGLSWLKYRAIWILFNFFFISLYQHLLLWLIVSPSFVAVGAARAVHSNDIFVEKELSSFDFAITFLMTLAIILETIADNQQWRFQSKRQHLKLAEENNAHEMKILKSLEDGFCQYGLFSIVRKPNYAAEQLIWISFYFFSVSSLLHLSKITTVLVIFNWSGLGFMLLVFLFQGSGWLTEMISIKKYPAYLTYQKKVPLYIPCSTIMDRKDKTS